MEFNTEIATIAEDNINSTFEVSLIGEGVENYIGSINDQLKLITNITINCVFINPSNP